MLSANKKFLLEPNDTSSPLYSLKEEWENFEFIYRLRGMSISSVISSFDADMMQELLNDPSAITKFTPENLETRLGSVVPEFMAAANGLRRMLDRLEGSRLAWNMILKKSAKKMDYPEDDGYLIGNLVGPHPAIGGFVVHLELADNQNQERGIFIPIQMMTSIRYFDANLLE